jgi:hypothetical protein
VLYAISSGVRIVLCCVTWQDPKKAAELYQLAGELGCIQAWKNLATMYATGHGVKKCEQTAQQLLDFVKGAEPPRE